LATEKMELRREIARHIRNRIGDYYVAKEIALSMTDLVTAKMTKKELVQWVEKLKEN